MITAPTLKNTDLFQDLSSQSLQAIVGIATLKSFEEGDDIYKLGDDANDLYFLDSGRVRFSIRVGARLDGSGSLIVPGTLFGWAALLHDEPRRVAAASCLEDSKVYLISREKILKLFEADSEAGYQVMSRLATTIAGDFISVLSV